MKAFRDQIVKWEQQDLRYIIATVISTWGSAPRPVGSKMLISENLEIVGSVSGGCVEGSIVKAAEKIFQSGGSAQLDFGISDEDAWAVGLSCGGKITVAICAAWKDVNPQLWEAVLDSWENDISFVVLEDLNNAGPKSLKYYEYDQLKTLEESMPLEGQAA